MYYVPGIIELALAAIIGAIVGYALCEAKVFGRASQPTSETEVRGDQESAL
jgi:hypothetical protein